MDDQTGSTTYELRPIGWVESPLTDPERAPRQGDEGAPAAWVVIEPSYGDAMRDLSVGAQAIVVTWLHRAARDVLVTHPRGDHTRPEQGVFSTRSPDRPNPIGLHTVQIITIDGTRIRVRHLEAINGTPVIDLKPVLDTMTYDELGAGPEGHGPRWLEHEGASMAVELNHTIVAARDSEASAAFMAGIIGLPTSPVRAVRHGRVGERREPRFHGQ